jgi:integrase
MSRRTKAPIKFPYAVPNLSRKASIYKYSEDHFETYFRYGQKPHKNSFKTFDAALLYLKEEIKKLDADTANSLSLAPLNGTVRSYAELEHLLREKGDGGTLRDAVNLYLAFRPKSKFKPMTVLDCSKKYVESCKSNNITTPQIKTLEKHFRRFNRTFGTRKIHDIDVEEISLWLNECIDEKTLKPWKPKTKRSTRASLVSLGNFARKQLKAIPMNGDETEFQKVPLPKVDSKQEVDIYTPAELQKLLLTAINEDIDMIPIIVLGCWLGLRPAEAHGEDVDRENLRWEAFIWEDGYLSVFGQKVRSKPTRHVPIPSVARKWLEPFRDLKGPIWRYASRHSKSLIALRKKAEVRSITDGYRHSYASYRIRQLKGDLVKLAEEMGNSPEELIASYKRNVTDATADAWFNVLPPTGYNKLIKGVLKLRKPTLS